MRLSSLICAAALACGVAVAQAQASLETPATVATFETAMGVHFTTKAGHTLYVYDSDEKPSQSTCVAGCAKNWPPLSADDAAKPDGDWSVFSRPDGSRQWAYKGRPVYTFAADPQPGATLGDGIQNVWHIAIAFNPRPPGVKYYGTTFGRVAADPAGKTLYARQSGECVKDCLKTWLPFTAPQAASPQGDWSIVIRKDDQTPQWAWRGQPLYTYRDDVQSGDTRGETADKAWHAILVQPAPKLPPWVTVTQSDYGAIFADRAGLTVYSTGELAKAEADALCNAACQKANWKPLMVEEGAVAVGNWSFLPLADGRRQWAYRGQPVYTFMHDKKAGDILGDKFAMGGGNQSGGWHVLPLKTMKEEPL